MLSHGENRKDVTCHQILIGYGQMEQPEPDTVIGRVRMDMTLNNMSSGWSTL